MCRNHQLGGSRECKRLRPPSRSIVTANGKALDIIMGQVDISLYNGKFSCKFLHVVLVTDELTQPCVLGADFLTKTR